MRQISRLPLSLLIAGIVGAAAALWLPTAETRPVDRSIDLRAGATTTVEFRAERSVQHEIGIEMDRVTAERLFPCTAGREYLGPVGQCPGAKLPVSLQVLLFENSVDRSDLVSPDTSVSGGRYVFAVEHQTFTRTAAYADLSRGKRYRLVIQSLSDGTAALPASPRLTVSVSPLDTMSETIIRFFGFWLAVAMSVVAGIWLTVVYLKRDPRSQPAGT